MMPGMTNHPGRRRGDDDEPSIEEMVAEAVEPLAAEMREKLEAQDRPRLGPAGVPAHTANGVPPGLKPDPVILAAKAVAQALGEHLPQMLFQAVAAALSQVPVQVTAQRPPCGPCIVQRIAWENAHKAAMDKAIAAASEAVTAQNPQPDLAPFLPEALRRGGRDGIPDVAQSITTFQGAEMCPLHVAQAAGVQPGRSPLLVATATMNPAMAGQFGAVRLRGALARRVEPPAHQLLHRRGPDLA
jgi:hypothetical protein